MISLPPTLPVREIGQTTERQVWLYNALRTDENVHFPIARYNATK